MKSIPETLEEQTARENKALSDVRIEHEKALLQQQRLAEKEKSKLAIWTEKQRINAELRASNKPLVHSKKIVISSTTAVSAVDHLLNEGEVSLGISPGISALSSSSTTAASVVDQSIMKTSKTKQQSRKQRVSQTSPIVVKRARRALESRLCSCGCEAISSDYRPCEGPNRRRCPFGNFIAKICGDWSSCKLCKKNIVANKTII